MNLKVATIPLRKMFLIIPTKLLMKLSINLARAMKLQKTHLIYCQRELERIETRSRLSKLLMIGQVEIGQKMIKKC